MNLPSSTTKRSWMPEPISPAPSLTTALKTSLLLSTSTSSVSQTTSAPMGDGAEWDISRRVPTVLWPPSSPDATLSDAAASMRATIAGVASTGRVPLPIASAVFSCVTLTALRPLMPVSSMNPGEREAYMMMTGRNPMTIRANPLSDTPLLVSNTERP